MRRGRSLWPRVFLDSASTSVYWGDRTPLDELGAKSPQLRVGGSAADLPPIGPRCISEGQESHLPPPCLLKGWGERRAVLFGKESQCSWT